MMGMTSCANDLNISSIDPQTSTSYEDMELLAKVYGTLGMTGQKGPAGAGDISSDEGESGFYRTTFNLQTLPTDECNWAWQITSTCRTQPTRLIRQTISITVRKFVSSALCITGTSSTSGTRLLSRTRTIP